MWLARDKSEILFLYISNYEPKKKMNIGRVVGVIV